MSDKTPPTKGLRGVAAARTALCTVSHRDKLRYRGYDIEELAEKSDFEEVAYLLCYGLLPNHTQYKNFLQRLATQRELPGVLRGVLERIPATTTPLNVLRTGCSMLCHLEPERDFSEQRKRAERLLATLPSMLLYWYRFKQEGIRIDTDSGIAHSGKHILQLLFDQEPNELLTKAINVSLILYAEHEFHAPSFVARICASTLSDLFSCVTAAISTLRNPSYGVEAVLEMLEQWKTKEQAEKAIQEILQQRKPVIGFGHPIYRRRDPRSAIIKRWAKQLSQANKQTQLFNLSEHIEKFMWQKKALFPNADFYHATAYHAMNIPTALFTPIFACARVSGWTAHVFEQRADNRLIRPSAQYIGPQQAQWLPMDERP